jgi:amino acid adenylation domain-containing protein
VDIGATLSDSAISQQLPPETAELRADTLVGAFERAAALFPSRVAIVSDAREPTYRELNEAANRLAYHLIACGTGLQGRAAIVMSHDAPMVAAVWGILKAGQIVVALDPGEPLARLKLLIEDAEPWVIVTDAPSRDLVAAIAPRGVRIVDFDPETATGPAGNPAIEIAPGQTAFFTYTSGTTGRPKGVVRTHRQLLGSVAAYTEVMPCTGDDRIPQFAAVSTGQGTMNLCWTLLKGATLCPFPVKTRGVTGLADWIVARGLTVYISSASIFRTLVKTIDERLVFTNVRAVRLASEATTTDDFRLFRKHFPPTSIFVHMLWSSEAGAIAWARWFASDDVPDGVLPVGHFARDVDGSLLGDDGRPVARGDVGEIVVRSRYVASGYWRDPELTAQRLSPDLDGTGTRQLRTGDLGRINAHGMLEFCGRSDDRIKIRGNRIEVMEVERAVETLPGIDRAAVVAIRQEKHEPLLAAFVVKTKQASWTASRLRHALRANLPIHAVPSRIVFVDHLPYSRGTKIDREALRQRALPGLPGREHVRPRSETEMRLASIWAETLDRPEIGRDDDFFDLGGDSLRGAVVAVQVHIALGVELRLADIADHPTVSALAAFVDAQLRGRTVATPAIATPPIEPAPRSRAMPLSLHQAAMWPRCRGADFTNAQRCRIIGPLDIDIYRACLEYVVERHEILRTTFAVVDGRPAQIVHASAPLDFTFIDLTGRDDAESRSDAIFRAEAARAIDLTALPILRHILVKVADNHHRLATVNNFMIGDGFSAAMLEVELAILYEAKLQGREPPLPRRASLQYSDYAVWQQHVSRPDSPYLKEMADWWKSLPPAPRIATRLPLKRLIRRNGLDPGAGIMGWRLEEQAAARLDEIARSAGTTPYIIRLAAFAALIADSTSNSTVVLGTLFDNRHRADAHTLAGRLVHWVPLVLHYDAGKSFREWVRIVHDRVFETLAHSELPFDTIQESLRRAGIRPPASEITFMLSRDKSDQRFANLTVHHEPFSVGTMPWGCLVHVDGKKPGNCQVRFDAGRHEPKAMRALLDRYCRLLEGAAREPELPVGALMTALGPKPLNWTITRWVAAFNRFLKWCRHDRKIAGSVSESK